MSTTATWKHQNSTGDTAAIDYEKMKQEYRSQLSNESSSSSSSSTQKESEILAVEGVMFSCPVCPASMPKSEIYEHIQECLEHELDAEPLMISVTMIHTLNLDKAKVENGIHVIGKYLQNIIDHGDEEKYRKIRKGNKLFSEKVITLKGVSEFLLKGCGFELKILPFEVKGETTDEEFYVLNEDLALKKEQLLMTKQMLTDAEPLEILLDRNMKVFEPSANANRMDIPSSFFSVTSTDVKQEQLEKSKEVDKMTQMRTQAMRESDKLPKRIYKFAVVRIRFPDGILLQGTFRCSEKLNDIKDFVKENLTLDWLPFNLCDSIGRSISDESANLLNLKLAPASVLTFCLDETMKEEIASSTGGKIQFLKDECLVLMQSISIK